LENDYLLFSGPSGVRLGAAVERLKPFFGDQLLHIDLEDLLCEELPATRSRLKEAGVVFDGASERIRMRDVTWELPKTTVKELWEEAATLAMDRLARYRGPGLRVLTSKFVYYGGRRHELYSPVTISKITPDGIHPRSIIVLIDDVFDMFIRLSQRGELFDQTRTWEGYVRRFEADEEVKFADLPARDRQAVALRHTVGQVRRVLAWRQAEITVAENIAQETKAKLLVWATKQSAKTVASWALNPDSCRTYLSHPISSVRRIQRVAREAQWPQLMEEVNGLQASLFSMGVVAVMPTGIDELRFQPFNDGHSERELPLHLPVLTARWPLPAADLLWDPIPSSAGIDHSNVLSVNWLADPTATEDAHSEPNFGRRRDAVIRGFEEAVSDQISARDHLFVEHCRSLLVYRPLFQGRPYSLGVQAEIDHWAQLAGHDRHRRIAFVHFDVDVSDFQESLRSEPNFRGKRAVALASLRRDIVARHTSYTPERAQQLLAIVESKHQEANILDESFMPDRVDYVRKNLPAIEAEAENLWLQDYLRYGLVEPRILPTQVRVWPVPGSPDLGAVLPAIAQFLES
jgi:hypothetical protein